MIYMNTYNVMVLDVSHEAEQNIIFRHESHQIWESECFGFLLHGKKDFVKINLHGLYVLSLGTEQKRYFKDDQGTSKVMHSLESVNYMKIDRQNYLLFECSKGGERCITIQ